MRHLRFACAGRVESVQEVAGGMLGSEDRRRGGARRHLGTVSRQERGAAPRDDELGEDVGADLSNCRRGMRSRLLGRG
jgi:hypothetical protein